MAGAAVCGQGGAEGSKRRSQRAAAGGTHWIRDDMDVRKWEKPQRACRGCSCDSGPSASTAIATCSVGILLGHALQGGTLPLQR